LSARSQAVARAGSALASGRNIELVGPPQSGRTSFLRALEEALRANRWSVHTLRGDTAYQGVPFAALALSELTGDEPNGNSAGQLRHHVAELERSIAETPAVLLIDNADRLDDASWAVVSGYASRHPETRVVITLTQSGGHSAHPRRLQALTIRVPPLTFRELRLSVESKLGAPLDDVTLGRIFARSGASSGLAHDLVDAAVVSGHLRKKGEEWSGEAGLWSDELTSSLESLLSPLTPAELDALELLAGAGVSELHAIADVVGRERLEALEARDLIRIRTVSGSLHVTVHPPLIEDYFANRPLVARRTRFAHVLESALHRDARGLENLSHLTNDQPASRDNSLIAQLIHEQVQNAMRTARAAWFTHPSIETAVAAAEAMIRAEAPETEIDAVFAAAYDLATSPTAPPVSLEIAASLTLLGTEWQAMGHGDLDGALQNLHESAPVGSVPWRIADAHAVSLERSMRRMPTDFRSRLAITPDIPDFARVRILRSRVISELISCDFDQAQATLLEAQIAATPLTDVSLDSVQGFMRFSLGDVDAAIDAGKRGYSEALSTLNATSLRAHAAVLVHSYEVQGRYAEAEEILATVLPVTYSPPSALADMR